MTQPRKTLISIEDTPYYHVVSRCVRRAFLCGVDRQSGQNYEHRRQWIEDRIRVLSSIFALDICAYAVMSNHLHIVVKLCPDPSVCWSTKEVLQRWTALYKGPFLVQQYLRGTVLKKAEQNVLNVLVEQYRERLSSLSWFMKCLNEPIAREANIEDKCTGHFWESRFKSQALLSESALLSCMAYVDLNPVRAGMAETPEESDHTSIKERLHPTFRLKSAINHQTEQKCLCSFNLALKPLALFEGNESETTQNGILFNLTDYLELLDYTGRILHPKKHAIPKKAPPILTRLNLSHRDWMKHSTQFEQTYQSRFAKPRRPRKQNFA